MRMLPLTLLMLALSTTLSQAQPTTRPLAGPAPAPANNAELDALLLKWEKTVQSITTFAARCGWTEKNPISGITETYKGTLHFQRSDKALRFLLHVDKIGEDGKPVKGDYRRFVSTGTYLYQYDPAQKQIHFYDARQLGSGKQQTALDFFVSMKAENAKKRFNMKLAKTDEHYAYVDIYPQLVADKGEFVQARIVLVKATMFPRQIWFKMADSSQVLWDVPVLKTGVAIPADTFAAPKVKAPWKLIRPKAKPSARRPVIRNQGN